MKPGLTKGKRLSTADKRAIRGELVTLARTTGARAYSFRWDGDTKVEFRAWPDGKCVVSPVADNGVSTAPQRKLTLAGVEARLVGAAAVGVAVAVEVVRAVL